jgi:YgiT-type zinc finger domain-containing protein
MFNSLSRLSVKFKFSFDIWMEDFITWKKMKCVICKNGETKNGLTSVSFQRKEVIIVVKNIPAEICENCGESYLSEEISAKVLQEAEQSIKKNSQVEVLNFAA